MSAPALRPAPLPRPRLTRRACVESHAVRIRREWDQGLRTAWRSEAPALDWIAWHGRALFRFALAVCLVAAALSFTTCALFTEVPIIDTRQAVRR